MMMPASILTARTAAINHLCMWVGAVAAAERHRQDEPGSLSSSRSDFEATPERFGSLAHAGEAVAVGRFLGVEPFPVVGQAHDQRPALEPELDVGLAASRMPGDVVDGLLQDQEDLPSCLGVELQALARGHTK